MTFTPMQLPSRSQAYERRRAEQEQNNRPFEQQQAYVNRQKAIEAEKAGQDLKAIASLAPTAMKLMMHQDEKADKRAKIYANELYARSRMGLSPEEREDPEYQEKLKEFNENKDRYSKLAQEAQANGASWDVVNEINNLSGRKAWHYGVQHLKSVTTGLEPYLTQGMSRDDIDITIGTGDDEITFTPREAVGVNQKMAVHQHLWELYQEENGLDAYRPGFLFDHFYEKGFAIKDKVANTIRLNEWKKASAINQQEILVDFGEDFDYQKALNGLLSEVDLEGSGDTYDYHEAHAILDEHIKDLADAGLITEEDIDKIAKQPSHVKGKLMGDTWKSKIQNWKNYIKDAREQSVKRKDKERDVKAKDFKNTFMDEMEEKYLRNGLFIPEEELERARQEHRKITGEGEPQWIKNIYTRQESDDDDARDYLDKLRKNRGLVKSDLENFSPQIYKEYIGFVEAEEAFMNIPDDRMDYKLNEIKSLASQAAGLNAEKTTSPEYDQMVENGQLALKARIRFLMSPAGGALPWDGKNGALNVAISEITEEFDLGSENAGAAFLRDTVDLDATHQLRVDVADATDEIQKDPNITKLPKGGERYIDLARQYRDNKLTEIPSYFDNISRMPFSTRLTSWDVMDRYLKSIGEPGLDASNEQINNFRKAQTAFNLLFKGFFERPTWAGAAVLSLTTDDLEGLFANNTDDEEYESLFNLPEFSPYSQIPKDIVDKSPFVEY